MSFPHNNEGRIQLLKDYDQEQLQEIANHGCESGVCSQHIYYVDTIAFFDKYEAEILDLIHERYGVDELVSIFKRSEACYDMYRNDCCWLFIENVATDVVIDNEESELVDEQLIADYMKESISNNGYTLTELNNAAGINPAQSMNLNRYSQV
tara:strand:+ start:302 stop:757 length:456 start_codon:yes stop_codon:yes gene_type:complete